MTWLSKRHDLSDRDVKMVEPFGTLLSVRHESSGGSMAYRSEFEIELSPKEIVSCAYWPQDVEQDMVRKTHVPVTAEQWADVEKTVHMLWPLFCEVKKEPRLSTIPQIPVLDGGDYSQWFLTRKTQNGSYTAQYYQPDDRRIRTLIELLREIAEPIGREIPRYDPPVLCGLYFQYEKKHCSYQCTPWDDGVDSYRYIAYDQPDKEKRSIYERVPITIWKETRLFLEPLRLEDLPNASGRDEITCTLYYSDGKQKRVALEKKTAEKLEYFFVGLTQRVLYDQQKKRG